MGTPRVLRPMGLLVLTLGIGGAVDLSCSDMKEFDKPGALKNRTLRVMFLASEGKLENRYLMENSSLAAEDCNNREKAGKIPECFNWKNWTGQYLGELFLQLQSSLGFNVVALTAHPGNFSEETNHANITSKGLHTRCAHEIAANKTDLCWGDFWETAERRKVTTFTTSFAPDHFYMYARKDPSPEVVHKLTDWLQPFEPEVWGWFCCMCIVVGVLMWALSHHRQYDPGEEGDFQVHERFPHPIGLFKSTWLALLGFAGPPRYQATTWPARIVLVAFGIFLKVVLSAYTANLAANLTNAQLVPVVKFDSLDKVVQLKAKVCVPQVLASIVHNALDGRGTFQFEELKSSVCGRVTIGGPELELLQDGKCDTLIYALDDYKKYAAGDKEGYDYIPATSRDGDWTAGLFTNQYSAPINIDDGICRHDDPSEACCKALEPVKLESKTHCNRVEPVERAPIASVNRAFPVHPIYERYVSRWLTEISLVGLDNHTRFKKVISDYESTWGSCPQPPGPASTKMAYKELEGIFVMCYAAMAVAVVMAVAKDLWARQVAARQAADYESDQDQSKRSVQQALEASRVQSRRQKIISANQPNPQPTKSQAANPQPTQDLTARFDEYCARNDEHVELVRRSLQALERRDSEVAVALAAILQRLPVCKLEGELLAANGSSAKDDDAMPAR